jgi:hypothetical protein
MSVTRPKLRSTARRARRKTRGALGKVPGPSSNPATNLMIIDIAMRGASMVFWRGMEKALLRARYDPDKASDIVKGRSMIKSAAATGAARMATRSVPGFLLVAGGLFAKAVFDRSLQPREAARRGDEDLAEQAAKADED